TEPLGLLVRVGVAADVDQQRGVVDDRARVLLEPEPLRDAKADQTLAEDVLHRLSEAEGDPERQRRNQLRQPDATPTGIATHPREPPRPPAAAPSAGTRRAPQPVSGRSG